MGDKDILVKILDHVFNPNFFYDQEKFLGGRTVNGEAFGYEASIRAQYCCGGFFIEGWAGGMRFRIYGNTCLSWRAYTESIHCNINENVNEYTDQNNKRGTTQDELFKFLKSRSEFYGK